MAGMCHSHGKGHSTQGDLQRWGFIDPCQIDTVFDVGMPLRMRLSWLGTSCSSSLPSLLAFLHARQGETPEQGQR